MRDLYRFAPLAAATVALADNGVGSLGVDTDLPRRVLAGYRRHRGTVR